MKYSVKIFISVFLFVISGETAHPESLLPESPHPVKAVTVEEFRQMIFAPDARFFLVFTASWCGPCKKELPFLLRLHQEYKDRGLRMVGLSLDFDGTESMQRIVDKYHVDFPVFWGGEPVMEAFNITSIPLIFLVKDGKITEKIPGNHSFEFLENKIIAFLSS